MIYMRRMSSEILIGKKVNIGLGLHASPFPVNDFEELAILGLCLISNNS